MSLLDEAQQLINNDRAEVYGDVNAFIGIVIRLWEPIFENKIEPYQFVQAMAALKLARTIVNPGHRDSWVDLAGYAGLSERVLIKGAGDGKGRKLSNTGEPST